jgi:hypothetical protein
MLMGCCSANSHQNIAQITPLGSLTQMTQASEGPGTSRTINYYVQDMDAVLNDKIPLKFFKETITGKSIIQLVNKYSKPGDGFEKRASGDANISIFTNSNQHGDSIPETNITYSFDSHYTPEKIFQSMYNQEHRMRLDKNILYYKILSNMYPGVLLTQVLFKSVLVANREFQEAIFTVKNAEGVFAFATCTNLDFMPPNPKAVRAEAHMYTARLVTVNDRTEVTLCSKLDLKLPTWQSKLALNLLPYQSRNFMKRIMAYIDEEYSQLKLK